MHTLRGRTYYIFCINTQIELNIQYFFSSIAQCRSTPKCSNFFVATKCTQHNKTKLKRNAQINPFSEDDASCVWRCSGVCALCVRVCVCTRAATVVVIAIMTMNVLPISHRFSISFFLFLFRLPFSHPLSLLLSLSYYSRAAVGLLKCSLCQNDTH